MTPEIKQRIQQIKQGKTPKGYKKTKVGIIPSEWSVEPLSNLLNFKNGYNTEKENYGKGTKLISIRDILQDKPIYYNSILNSVDISSEHLMEFSVEYGDILFQRSSETYEDAGTTNVYLDRENVATFSGFVIRGKKMNDYEPVCLNSILRLKTVRNAIIRKAAGAQHVNIGQESLAKTEIPLPPLSEQTAIAEILTTQDRIIELKEQLLAEKKRQKKYLMQQLLTGKKRLKGFKGEWKRCKLSDFCTFVGGGTPSTNNDSYWNGSIPWISSSDLQNDNFRDIVMTRFITDEAIENSATKICPEGTILVVSRVGVGKIAIAPCSLCTSQDFTNIIQNIHCNTFLVYLLCFEIQKIINQVQGSAIKGLPASEIKNISIILPPLPEQTAIAEILSTADREIELLGQSIEAEKRKKKSLMQLLLTGIVRVN